MNPVNRLFLVLLTVLYCATTFGQCRTNKELAESKALKLSPLFGQFVALQQSNKDSARVLSRYIIKELQEVYCTDTTNKDIGHYLAFYLYYDKQIPSAIQWYLKQLESETYIYDKANHNAALALCFAYIGELDSIEIYLNRSFSIDGYDKNLRIQSLVNNFEEIAKELSCNFLSSDFSLLRSKFSDPCEYAPKFLKIVYGISNRFLSDENERYNTSVSKNNLECCR
ncbi:hypothetical protein OI18_23235 [Flavihumibacter solisilvae]|uniref:Uncharacterized protein n=2 Tax=Flavihumibacter solisilvae TaxID=1349421 RepID=A0A0C1IJQ7_9BACT|nr:hypothetical protein OI18_23235 [Flavihumibacter solisilvae]